MTTEPTVTVGHHISAIDAYIAGQSVARLRYDYQQISAFVAESVQVQAEHPSPQRAVRLDHWQRFGRRRMRART
jgi:hypothetical protein